jgi:hypothetical protein
MRRLIGHGLDRHRHISMREDFRFGGLTLTVTAGERRRLRWCPD